MTFPIGSRVIIDGLSKGVEYNGKVGEVRSALNSSGRQEVFVKGPPDKAIALRPSNLMHRPVDSLSVKEMKMVLKDKDVSERELTGMDKAQLMEMVREKATPEEVTTILAAANAPPSPPARAPSSDLKEQLQSQAEQMENMNPEQLRQQAQMMKSMDPATIRRMNPQLAGMSDAQIRMAADQMEAMASNPSMMKSMAQQVKNMSPEEMEQVHKMQGELSAGVGGAGTATTTRAGGATTTTTPVAPTMTKEHIQSQAERLKSMDPEQIKKQAAMMRTMDPATVRTMNPAMAGMSDEQIRAAADQMEAMASNPAMMKMAADQVKNMSSEDFGELQKMQGQVGGAAGAGGASAAAPPNMNNVDPAKMMENMDPKQMKAALEMMKKNPSMMKQMMASNPAMANMSEEQLTKALDMFSNMDEAQMKKMMGMMAGFQKVSQPVVNAWGKVNRLFGGHLSKILFIIGAGLLVYLFQSLGWVPSFGTSSSAVDKLSSTPLGNSEPDTSTRQALHQEDEFAEL